MEEEDSCGLFDDLCIFKSNRHKQTMLQLPLSDNLNGNTEKSSSNNEDENFNLEFGSLATNTTKTKTTAKPKKTAPLADNSIKKKNRKSKKDALKETNKEEAVAQLAAPSSPERSLSPISQMLLQQDQRKQDEAPISHRTRRSTGKRASATTLIEIDNVDAVTNTTKSPPKRGRRRTRKQNNNDNNIEQNNDALQTMLSQIPVPVAAVISRNCMRARRQYFSELAARATTVDSIDLVSAVMPRVEGFISLDSDDEEAIDNHQASSSNVAVPPAQSKLVVSKNDDLLDSPFDADNPQMSIKIRWNGNHEKYLLRKYQKFSHIMQEIAERKQVPIEDVVLNLNDKFIKPDDTPDSVGYKIYNFIDGRAMKFSDSETMTAKESTNTLKTNAATSKSKAFHLKVQSDKWKRPLIIELKKTDIFKILYIKCAEQLDLHITQLKLIFDGETLEFDDTPENLDLEGGEIVDCRIKN